MYLSFQTPNLYGDESYLRLRQVEHIKKTFRPLHTDQLSFAGRQRVNSPLFDYLLTLFSFIFGSYFGKIISNLFAVSLMFIVYLITQYITQNSYVSLLTAFISGFIPIFFMSTFNSLTIYALVIPLTAFLMYSFLKVAEKKWLYSYIIALGFYCFLHPTVVLFILGLLFYFLLMKLEHIKINKEEIEITLFSIFFVLWSQFLIYKSLLLSYGPLIIWQNIPRNILTDYFANITVVQIILWIGIIPSLYGLFVIWKYIFKQQKREIYFLIGFAFSTGLLLWSKLIKLNIGLIFFGMILVLLFGVYYKTFIDYLLTTKISGWLPLFKVTIILSFILTSTLPSIILAQKALSDSSFENEILALDWLSKHIPEDTVILGTVEEGNLIAYITKQKTVLDSDFMTITDSDEIFDDVKTIYTSPYDTLAIELLNKYSIDYIIISPYTKKMFNFESFKLTKNERCFDEVYDENQIVIYKSLCKLK